MTIVDSSNFMFDTITLFTARIGLTFRCPATGDSQHSAVESLWRLQGPSKWGSDTESK